MRVTLATTMRARLVGLIGKRDFDGILVLAPCNDIHTFTIRRPPDTVVAVSNGIVIEAHRAVPPNRRLRNRKAVVTLERFASEEEWYAPGDCIHRYWS